jgi:hypothetical protein
MKSWRIISVTTIFGLLVIFGLSQLFYFNDDQKKSSGNQWINEKGEIVESYWKDLILKVGPEKAYDEFSALNMSLDNLTQHLNGHIFGKALFEAAGEESITVCDFSFGAGCFHEVVSSVIARDGLGSQSKIITKCVEKSDNEIEIGDCYHAYGHGVAYYFSGEDANVPLNEECANYEDENSLSCASGVLMEYVSPGFLADSEAPKFTSVEEIATMCESLDGFFQPKCYPRLIQWWGGQLQLEMPPEEYVVVQEQFCNTLVDPLNRHSCFESIGLFVIGTWVGLDSKEVQKYCALIDDRLNSESCISGAIIRIAIMTEEEKKPYQEDLESLCVLDLAKSNKVFCPS